MLTMDVLALTDQKNVNASMLNPRRIMFVPYKESPARARVVLPMMLAVEGKANSVSVDVLSMLKALAELWIKISF